MIFFMGGGRWRTSVGTRHDLIATRQLRLLQQVDHFDAVPAGQVLLRRSLSRFRSAADERALCPAT